MVLGNMYRRKSPSDEAMHSVISGPLRALELAFQEAELRSAEIYRRGMLPDRPSLIDHGPIRILVSSTPMPDQLESYANTLTYYNVKHVVRVCEPTYDANMLRELGFAVHEWPFADGDAPPEAVIEDWLGLLDQVFSYRSQAKATKAISFNSDTGSESELSPSSSADKPKETIAVHCVAGLGRAPALAAIALVELGLDPYEAVGWIRALRRGAINARQMAFVESFARRPPPPAVKPGRSRPRSGSFVGSLWPSLKAARPFRPRSPSSSREGSQRNSPASSKRFSPVSYNTMRVSGIMERAFETFEDCLQDSVMAACGAYGSASLQRVFAAVEHRHERYFNGEGEAVTICSRTAWKQAVRRKLFTSRRFAVQPLHEELQFFVASTQALAWYYYLPFVGHARRASHAVDVDLGRKKLTLCEATESKDDASPVKHLEILRDDERSARSQEDGGHLALLGEGQEQNWLVSSPTLSNQTQLTSKDSFSSLETRDLLEC